MGVLSFLSWSVTRLKLLERCPRAFFFSYCFRGEAEERQAQLLRRLGSIEMLAGDHVDLVLMEGLGRFAEGNGWPDGLSDFAQRGFARRVEYSREVISSMARGLKP